MTEVNAKKVELTLKLLTLLELVADVLTEKFSFLVHPIGAEKPTQSQLFNIISLGVI